MYYTKKIIPANRFMKKLAFLLIFLLVTGILPVSAAAAERTGVTGAESSLLDESRTAPIRTGASGATWKKVGSHLRLKGSNGKYKTGFVKYSGKYYYFNHKGNLKIGFFTSKGNTWFASRVKGAKGKGQILTGLVKIDGSYYFLNPGSKRCPGAVSKGFQKISGRRYYFDKKGRMVTGWFSVGSSKYYASCNKKKNYGALLTGIQKIGKKTCQFNSDGRLVGTVEDAAKQTSVLKLADFKVINQLPDLPTGCEVTSLTMVLNYYGFPADKMDLANNYLPKGPVGSTDFRKAFVGDPRNSWSRGCYAPVIVKTANKYLSARKSKMKAVDISGTELTALSAYTNANVPVIVWNTMGCKKPYNSVTWTINGKKLTWISPEHCLVLVGFANGRVKVADPDGGKIRLYDLDLFRSRYNALYKQAVLIQ